MSELFEKHRDDLKNTVIWNSNYVRYLPHYHSGVEVVYVLSGTISAIIGGRSVSADAGSALVSGAYTVHSYGEEPSPAIVAIIPPGEVPSLQKRLMTGRFLNPVCPDDRGSLLKMLELLHQYTGDDTIRKGMSYAVLGFLMQRAGFEVDDDGPRGGVMAQVLSYLSKNYSQAVTAEALAAHFGYSRSRFSHLFKANIGVSIPRYLNILRCRDAAEALVETDMPVIDVAINAGFNNTHTFYTAFRELYHMTPGEYVKSARAARMKKP